MLLICAACQVTNSPKSRFCQGCGAALPPPESAQETTEAANPDESTVSHTAAVTAAYVTEPDAPAPASAETATPEPATLLPAVPSSKPEHIRRDPETSSGVGTAPTTSTSRAPVAEQFSPPPVPPAFADETTECPFILGLNFDRVFVAENPSTFEVMVESRSEMPLHHVEIHFESTRALGNSLRLAFRRIVPGQQLRRRLEIEPLRAGNFVLQCSVITEVKGKKQSFVATRPLRVNTAPDTSNISINVSDILNNSDEGANAGLGKELRDNKVTTNIDMSRIKTLNDLLDLELPENFQPVDLQLDYQINLESLTVARAGSEKSLVIPSRLVGVCQPGTVLRLTPAEANGASLAFVSRPRFSLGRSRKEADFTTWFWPRSEDNDAKTMRISKVHAAVEVCDQDLIVREVRSSNGSTYNDVIIDSEDGLRLDRRGTLTLATEYNLSVLHVPTRLEGASLPISNIGIWGGPPENGQTNLGAVRFIPQQGEPSPFQSLWLLSDAEFGRSHSNPLILEDEALAEIQGRFVYHRGCFWIENIVPNAGVSVEGTDLNANEIAPLASGQQLRLGGANYRVEVTAE